MFPVVLFTLATSSFLLATAHDIALHRLHMPAAVLVMWQNVSIRPCANLRLAMEDDIYPSDQDDIVADVQQLEQVLNAPEAG